MKKQRRQQFDGGGSDPAAAYYSRHSSQLPPRDPAHTVPDHATTATAVGNAATGSSNQPQISSSRELSTANDNYDLNSSSGNRKYSHRRSHR